MLLEVSNSEFI